MTADARVGDALRAWSRVFAGGGSAADADVAAVQTMADDPWAAASVASLLLASHPEAALEDYGLTASFRLRNPRGVGVVCTFARGTPYPALDPKVIMAPQRDLAMRVADAARSVAEGPARRAVVRGGGVGTFALALEAWGIPDVEVVEPDERAAIFHQVVAPRARLLHRAESTADLVLAVPGYFPAAVGLARAGGGVAYLLPDWALDDARGAAWRGELVQYHRVRGLSGPQRRPGSDTGWWLLSALGGGGPGNVLGVPADRVMADVSHSLRSPGGDE